MSEQEPGQIQKDLIIQDIRAKMAEALMLFKVRIDKQKAGNVDDLSRTASLVEELNEKLRQLYTERRSRLKGIGVLDSLSYKEFVATKNLPIEPEASISDMAFAELVSDMDRKFGEHGDK